MPFTFEVDAQAAFARFDAIGPGVRHALLDELTPLAAEITDDARARALAHFHSIGKKPGQYLASIHGGVADKGSRVVGWVRSSDPLAHLLELGFTISDMTIGAKGGGLMTFDTDSGVRSAFKVHRHETKVEPYPAIEPAFAARRGDVMAAMERVKQKAANSE